MKLRLESAGDVEMQAASSAPQATSLGHRGPGGTGLDHIAPRVEPDPPRRAVPGDAPGPATGDATLGQSVLVMGGVNLAAFLGGIVRQKVFAVVLGPVGIGALSLATSFLEVVLNVCRMGTPTGLLREVSGSLAAGDRARAARVFLDLRRIALVVGIATLALGALVARPLSDVVFRGALPPWAVLVILLAVPLSLQGQLSQTMINAVGSIPRLGATKVAITGVGLVISLCAVVAFGLNGALIQLAIAAGVSVVISQWSLGRLFDPRREGAAAVAPAVARSSVRGAFRVGAGEAVSHVAIALNLLLFRSVLVGRLGLVENGMYQAVMGLSRQYTIALSGAVFVYLYPKIAAATASGGTGTTREVRRSLRFILSLAVPAALLLLGTRDVLVPLLLSEEFLPMVPLLGFSAPGDLLAVVVALFQIVLLALGRTRVFVFLAVGGEILYLILFLVGLSMAGLTGAVASYAVWGLVMVPAFAWAMRLDGPGRGLGWEAARLGAGVVAVGVVALMPVGGLVTRLTTLGLIAAWAVAHRDGFRPGGGS